VNCEQAQARLAELVYAEADSPDSSELRDHVASCRACTAELESLQQAARLLTTAAAVDAEHAEPAALDPSAVHRRAGEFAARGRLHWRRGALAAAALAAVLLVVVAVQAMSLRVEIHGSHLVIGWGGAASEAPSGERDNHASGEPNTTSNDVVEKFDDPVRAAELLTVQRRFEELDMLVRLLAAQQSTDEGEYRLLAQELRRRIDRVEQTNDLRLRTVGRGMHNLYLTNATAAATHLSAVETPEGETP
jgi:hypothetical protein